ncbi:MAG: O-antigen ligase family protein [Legionella sp.]
MLSTYNKFDQWSTEFAVPFFLIASLFFVPISSSAKSLFIALSVTFILLTKSYRSCLKNISRYPWSQAAVGLFLLAILGCGWSHAWGNERLLVLEKYSKLLYLPILAVGFKDAKIRFLGLHAFMAAMFITCLLSILKFTQIIQYHGTDAGEIFHNHIMTGYMMSLAAYLSAYYCGREHGWFRIGYGILTLIFSFQLLFINTSRTGTVVFFVLLMIFFVQTFSWRHLLTALIITVLTIITSYCLNHNIKIQVDQAINDWHLFHQQNHKDTSLGYRIQFHDYAKKLFYRHPIIGNGTASFTYTYGIEKPVPSWSRRLLEPHSQYWLVLAEFGIVGIFLLVYFFASLFFASLTLQSMKFVAIAVLLPFFLGNLSDSLLFYSGTGYCFLLFMALCLGEQQQIESAPP